MITHVPHRANPIWLIPGPAGQGFGARVAYSLSTRASRWAQAHLAWLNLFGARVTVRDLYSTPGDTLLTAIVCRHLKERWPRLKINCLTKNPDLLIHDPNLGELNGPPGLFLFDFWYFDLQARRDPATNILAPFHTAFHLTPYVYQARVYLDDAERAAARARLAGLTPPFIAINTLSAQPVKNWPAARWQELIPLLACRGSVIHLGDNREPELPVARNFAGKLTMRESMAVLAECALHLGPDSFLMHVANGLDVRSVIILGGSRTPANLGYQANVNLFTDLPCSACWLTGHPGSECPHELACLTAITPAQVLAAVDELLARTAPAGP